MSEAMVRLVDEAEVLFRQAHPHWIDSVKGPLSAIFQPGRNDAGNLSTNRERIGAEESYNRCVNSGRQSAGVLGATVGEAHAFELTCWDDTAVEGTPPDHASIDFTGRTGGQAKQAARKLRDAALARGWLYEPPRT